MIHIIRSSDIRSELEKSERPMLAVKSQLHDMESPEKIDLSDPNIVYAGEWDGKSPWIVVHKGRISDLKMAYAGWPMVTQDEYEASLPKAEVK